MSEDNGSAWTCEQHGTTQPDGRTSCPPCMEAFKNRRPVVEMTVAERIAEVTALGGQLTIPFDNMHQRMEELMARPVWTHEMAYPDALLEELRNGERVGFADVIAKLPWDKPVILVNNTDVQILP